MSMLFIGVAAGLIIGVTGCVIWAFFAMGGADE